MVHIIPRFKGPCIECIQGGVSHLIFNVWASHRRRLEWHCRTAYAKVRAGFRQSVSVEWRHFEHLKQSVNVNTVSVNFNQLVVSSFKWHLRYSVYTSLIPATGKRFDSSSKYPERLRGPPSYLYNGYWWRFPRGYSCRVVKLTTHQGKNDLCPCTFLAWIGTT